MNRILSHFLDKLFCPEGREHKEFTRKNFSTLHFIAVGTIRQTIFMVCQIRPLSDCQPHDLPSSTSKRPKPCNNSPVLFWILPLVHM